MSHGDKRRGRRGEPKPKQQDRAGATDPVDESSEVIQQFLGYQRALDTKHDKHERLVKLSRDVTIESKRAIFLMHRISGDEEKKKILPEAHKKLLEIQTARWRPIAEELHGEDTYKYLRAFSAGLQEYIEALSFYQFLDQGDLISVEEVEKTLVFRKEEPEEPALNTENQQTLPTQTDAQTTSVTDSSQSEPPSGSGDLISIHIPPMEYMLGIADLTGEVMRMAINSVGSGKFEEPSRLCGFLRAIHNSFLLFGNSSRELSRKMYTLKQSLQKVEAVCYTLQVRGSEIPKHMLVDVLQSMGSASAADFTERDHGVETV